MATVSAAPAPAESPDGPSLPRKFWLWFLVIGIAMVALGTFVIGWSCLATVTVAATWALGFVLLAGGIAEIFTSFSAGRTRSLLVHLLIGVLYAVAGFVMIDRPVESALVLTKFLAIFLIVGGAFRIFSALIHRFPHWGLVLLNGVVSLALGVMIYKEWPASGLWFIGMAFGIDMIMSGWTWIMLSLGLRRLPAAA